MKLVSALLAGVTLLPAAVKTAVVAEESVERTVRLPGELLPWQSVDLHARVAGYVRTVSVDRGSMVRRGQTLVTLEAPEMQAQISEAEARVKSLEASHAEAQARTAGVVATAERLRAASAVEGAIAGIELIQAEKSVEAARAAESGVEASIRAARASLTSLRQLGSYLRVSAPFDGVVTERYVHPGALAGQGGASATPLLRIEQLSRLRLVVAVPEADTSGIVRNSAVAFTVPAYPQRTFRGRVARVSRSLDPKTRTMPVELDVANTENRLSPGMYSEVQWPVRTGVKDLVVPPSAVVTTTARTFVIRVVDGRAEWVDVRKGRAAGERVVVHGDIKAGDIVVAQANDEIRPGSSINTASRQTQ